MITVFWIIIAAVVWCYILVFIKIEGLKKYWSVVIWSLLLAYFINDTFVSSGLYLFQDIYYPFQGLPLAYLISSAGKGIIIIRYLPEERWWQLFYLILFAIVITAIEFFAFEGGYLVFLQWSLSLSLTFRLIAYITLAWLSMLTVREKKSYLYR